MLRPGRRTSAQERLGPTTRLVSCGLACVVGAWVACYAPTGEDFVGVSPGVARARARDCSLQAGRPGDKKEDAKPIFDRVLAFDTARVKTYDGYVYKRAPQFEGVRLRLARFGHRFKAHYKIQAISQNQRQHGSEWFRERLGYYDPFRELDDPEMFRIRADRAVYWLRNGAQPTPMVANILDWCGIIRRTGPSPKMGQWEWRIPQDSGPDVPEGWSYDGVQKVTWNSVPRKNQRRHKEKKFTRRDAPLIERYGFLGYEKVPMDLEELRKPATTSRFWQTFDNTELPTLDN